MMTELAMETSENKEREIEIGSQQESNSAWLIYAIQGVLVLAAIFLALSIYHFTIFEKTVQKFALLDINEVVGLKQLTITELSLRKEATDKSREDLYDQITAFTKDIEKAVSEIQTECGCTLLVRSAVVKTSDGEDLTPLLKARLGLDKSTSELTELIRRRTENMAQQSQQ